jgi:hypothetical protein
MTNSLDPKTTFYLKSSLQYKDLFVILADLSFHVKLPEQSAAYCSPVV